MPPYGSIYSENNFFNNDKYKKGFEKIVIFEATGITNVLKLKAVALEPSIITKKEYEELCDKVFYKGKQLTKINFGTYAYFDPLDVRKIFNVTYLIKKEKYYNLEKDNILICHNGNAVCNKLKNDSLEKAKELYEKEPDVLSDTTFGQKNYCNNADKIGPKFEQWFEAKVKPLLKPDKCWILKTVEENSIGLDIYDDNNLINNLQRTSDENLYTNFIQTVLHENEEIRKKFFEFLVSKEFNQKNYESNHVYSETQRQALVDLKRAANSLIKHKTQKRKSKMENLISKYEKPEIITEVQDHIRNKDPFINGFIDLYLEDDNYRIVIENKIYSNINGKQKDFKYNQIDTYNNYLMDLNKSVSTKKNCVILLVPESEKNSFGMYNIITYKDIYEFFKINKDLIKEENRDDFINALAFHALTKEEKITSRFLKVLS